jgi:hypothetical protein
VSGSVESRADILLGGDALPGAYSEQADIADRNNPADRARAGGEADGPACVAISQISLKENGLPQAQVTKIAIAVKPGSLVITFTDGKDLPGEPAGSRSYTSHWLV